MSFAHPSWSSVESTDNPMIFTFLLSNCGFIFAMYPSSVVQTGVKSFGCENKTAHESPIQSWNWIRPSVVSASKSGAVSPICSAIPLPSLCLRNTLRESLVIRDGLAQVALVSPAFDDLGNLTGREAKLVVRVEEVRAEADACVGPEVADDLALLELTVDGRGFGGADDDGAAPAFRLSRRQHVEACRPEQLSEQRRLAQRLLSNPVDPDLADQLVTGRRRVERGHVRRPGEEASRAFGVVLLRFEGKRPRMRLPAGERRLQPLGELRADVEPAGAGPAAEPLDTPPDGEVDPERSDVERNRARGLVGV